MALGGARFRYIISSNTLGRFGLAMGEGAKRILLVEDTEVNRVVVRRLVRELNVSLEEAENGQAAVDLIRGGRTYDLILMDKEMPVVDGHEATRQIRSLGVTTPIVALSGDSLESDRDLFLQAGADEFQPK
ncbi:Two-component response regulator ORR41, partial [Ananas comosus]